MNVFSDNQNEMQVLGCVLMNNEIFNDLRAKIPDPEYFSNPLHRLIYEAMITVSKNDRIDIISIAGDLEKRGLLDRVGGLDLLTAIDNEVATWRVYETYAKRLVKSYQLRCVYEAAEDAARIIRQSDNADDARAEAVSRLLQTGHITESLKVVTLSDSLATVVDQSREAYKNPKDVTGVPTGFRTLDWLTSGLQPGFLYILGAKTGQGKSVFGLGLTVTAALNSLNVLYISLEMAPHDLARRVLASMSSVSSDKIRSGRLTEAEIGSMLTGTKKIQEGAKLVRMIDAPSLSVTQLRATATALQGSSDIDLIVVDYLQLIRSTTGHSREREVADISANLVSCARECDVPIVALSQLNQDGNVRESRAVEHDASCVMRLDYDDDEWQSEEDVVSCKLRVLKNRHGRQGSVNMVFDRPNQRFFEEAKDKW